MTYPSKVDRWIGIVLAAAPIGLTIEAILLRSFAIGVVAASIVVIYGVVVFPTNYELNSEALIVRSGLIRRVIPYRQIHQVRASRSVLSAPALSLERLEISYGSSRAVLISPQDKAGFLRELAIHLPAVADLLKQ